MQISIFLLEMGVEALDFLLYRKLLENGRAKKDLKISIFLLEMGVETLDYYIFLLSPRAVTILQPIELILFSIHLRQWADSSPVQTLLS